MHGCWCRLNLSLASRGFTIVMCMRAAQKGNLVEHVFLEPFEPEINDRRNEQRDHLREDQTPHDYQTQRTARCGVLAETQRNRDCAHKGCERCHHDGTKTFHA